MADIGKSIDALTEKTLKTAFDAGYFAAINRGDLEIRSRGLSVCLRMDRDKFMDHYEEAKERNESD